MTRTEAIDRIARRALAAGVSPAEAARDEVERDFIRANSAQVWERISAIRAGKKRDDGETEEGVEDPEAFEKCERCSGTGMLSDTEVCPDCAGSGDKNYIEPEYSEAELDRMRTWDPDDPSCDPDSPEYDPDNCPDDDLDQDD